MTLAGALRLLLAARLAACGHGQGSGFSPLSGLFALYQSGRAPAAADGGSGFITVSQESFTDQSCNEFIPIGFNAWTDVNLAARDAAAAIPLPVASLYDQNDSISTYFKAAKSAGFNVVRVFGHGNSSTFSLQTAPGVAKGNSIVDEFLILSADFPIFVDALEKISKGVYDEAVFKGFDYIIAQAGVNKLKVIFVVINNWLDQNVGGGKLKYCQWAKLEHEDEFWTDSTAASLVRDHLTALASRKNVFTGVKYNEDPNIFYWQLFYEPRCPAAPGGAGCPGAVTTWYDSMAQFMKAQDGNHLISTGGEGFFAVNSTLVNANPSGIPSQYASQGRFWSANLGQDFEEQHRRASIGLAAFQMWPENYNTTDPDFAAQWIGNHTIAARALGKPLILDEFGKASYQADESDRISLFNSVFDALQRSLIARDNFKGILFWRWPISNASADSTTVSPGQSTFSMIQQQITSLQSYMHNTLPSCGGPVNVLAFAQRG